MIDVEILTKAIVEVEENHLNGACLNDTCEHFARNEKCPEYSIGCGDAEEIAAEYNKLVGA